MRKLLSVCMVVFLGLFVAACSSTPSLPGEEQIKDAVSKGLYSPTYFSPDIPVTQVVSAKRTNSMEAPYAANALIVDFEANIIFPTDGVFRKNELSMSPQIVFTNSDKGNIYAGRKERWAKGDTAEIKGQLVFLKTEKGWRLEGHPRVTALSIAHKRS